MSLKDSLNKGKPIIGVSAVTKKIRENKVNHVYVAFNYHNKDQIVRLGKINNIKIEVVDSNSKQLGVLCKKPFNIAVVGFQ